MAEQSGNMKMRVARTLKWNLVDKVATQILYAVTGIILARVLSEADFGLIGAILVFQAFASMFVDSGFSYALIQRKNPTDRDYSTVLWFNVGIASLLYVVLFFSAPLIADCFQGDARLIPLSRVMFLTFILNALAIVQTNRLMKRMDVRMIAVSNSLGLIGGGAVGIVMALTGFGPWALVWQAIVVAAIKTSVLWLTSSWRPLAVFSWTALKSFFKVGSGAMVTSFLNTLFQNIYSFFIGNRVGLVPLGYYTQADKWSKMGSASISQVLTASFVPLMSRVQDSPDDFHRYMRKVNRFTAFILFPALLGLAVVGAPLFHLLFGNKWDDAIPLFQILAVRGVFVVLLSLCSNYLLALGKGKLLMTVEVIKDALIFIAILLTVFGHSVTLLVWGQLWASVATWAIVVWLTSRATAYPLASALRDMAPFALTAAAMTAGCALLVNLDLHPVIILASQLLLGTTIYISTLYLSHTPELKEASGYLLGRFRKKN